MNVLVIIVSYNFERWIVRCLGSLRLSEHPADTVVIDNGSQDRTTELVKAGYPEVRLIETGANLGFGRANNIGTQIALKEGYDFVFLLNQDAWIDPQTIGTLVRKAGEEPRYGILSPVHLTGTGNEIETGFSTYSGIRTIEELSSSENIRPLPFINAAFWLIPATVLRIVGGFSPLFYHYGEDKDYMNRLHYHGYLCGYSPVVSGCHDRESRRPDRAAYIRSVEVYLLSEYANIRYSFPKAFAYGVLGGLKKAAGSLFRGKPEEARTYAGISFRLLKRSGEIRRIRRSARQPEAHFITN